MSKHPPATVIMARVIAELDAGDEWATFQGYVLIAKADGRLYAINPEGERIDIREPYRVETTKAT